MRNQALYSDDPYTEKAPEASIPELGKDWSPAPKKHARSQPASSDTRPGTQPTDTSVGSKQQMKNEMRYTSVMKKDDEMNKEKAAEKVDDIVTRSTNILMKLTAVFPFDFFPSVITIDANKITIIDQTFFASETVTPILLEEVTDVVVESNFFLGRMIRTYSHHPLQPLTYAVANLRKKEALRAQEIIQGLLVLRLAEGVDLSKLQPEEITKELSRIGKPHEKIPAL